MSDPPADPARATSQATGKGINWRAFDYYDRLRRVREHLERDISRSLSTADAARIAGLNPSYFSSFFRSKVGARYTEWARYLRIERAMAIMRAENRSIAGVARDVGYNDLRTFERAFKRQTGITPREYRRRVRPSGRRLDH